MNSFLELVKARHSDRAYLDKPVEIEKLERILEAARLAPSACNAQPWKIIVVTDTGKRHEVAGAASGKMLSMNLLANNRRFNLFLLKKMQILPQL